jgi:hypothetical protein
MSPDQVSVTQKFQSADCSPPSKDRDIMSSRAGTWMIAVGALGGFAGLCVLPAALGEHGESNLLGVGLSLFSLGVLAAATGMYLKAQALQPSPHSKSGPGATQAAPANPGRKIRGGCDLCGTEAPVVQCKVHQLHLCGTCLAAHYDTRSCAYVPTSRKSANKAGKGMSAKAW